MCNEGASVRVGFIMVHQDRRQAWKARVEGGAGATGPRQVGDDVSRPGQLPRIRCVEGVGRRN